MLNHVCLQGRICNDIELRRTGSGVAVASFTLAVDRDFKNAGGEKETDFFDIVCWRNTAEFVQKYFGKGNLTVVSGRLQGRSWEDSEGKKRKAVEVVADSVYFCERKKESTENAANPHIRAENFVAKNFPAENFAIDFGDEQLPF
jgi:single-strand DNA-binding protein